MVKLVLLLSLLSVIIGWSEAKDVCGFSLGEGVLWPKLKTEKKNEESGEVLLEFEEMPVLPLPRLELHFACSRKIGGRIMNHEHTVEFDLYLNGDGIQYASVKYLKILLPQAKYIIKQSGDFGPAAYDISGYMGNLYIIPSNLLTGESATDSTQQYGYRLFQLMMVFMDFGGLNSKTIRAYELRFEYKRVTPRTHTTVAIVNKAGTIIVIPVLSLDETITVLKTKYIKESLFAMVLSEEQELDGKIFESPSTDEKILFLDNDKKATYDSPPLPPPAVTSGSPDRQSSGKKRRSSAHREQSAKRRR